MVSILSFPHIYNFGSGYGLFISLGCSGQVPLFIPLFHDSTRWLRDMIFYDMIMAITLWENRIYGMAPNRPGQIGRKNKWSHYIGEMIFDMIYMNIDRYDMKRYDIMVSWVILSWSQISRQGTVFWVIWSESQKQSRNERCIYYLEWYDIIWLNMMRYEWC